MKTEREDQGRDILLKVGVEIKVASVYSGSDICNMCVMCLFFVSRLCIRGR